MSKLHGLFGSMIIGALALGCGGGQDTAGTTGPTEATGTTDTTGATDTKPAVRDAKTVLEHHLASFGKGDVDAILSDYTDSSVLITPMGTLRGPVAIRPVFAGMTAEFAKPGMKFKLVKQVIEGEVAFIVWTAETADNVYELATDTFVIKDGKIVSQTFAAKLTPKAAAK